MKFNIESTPPTQAEIDAEKALILSAGKEVERRRTWTKRITLLFFTGAIIFIIYNFQSLLEAAGSGFNEFEGWALLGFTMSFFILFISIILERWICLPQKALKSIDLKVFNVLDPDTRPNECLELNKWINTDECVKEYFSKLDRDPVIGDHRAANTWMNTSGNREAKKAFNEIVQMGRG